MRGFTFRSALCLSILVDAQYALAGTPPPPRLVLVDPSSAEFQTRLSRDLAVAREKALRVQPVVVRRFVVGWEMHHGYYLLQEHDTASTITPDLLDANIAAAFDAQNRNAVLAKHAGEKLLCECRGIEWTFHSDARFIVQGATLIWTR